MAGWSQIGYRPLNMVTTINALVPGGATLNFNYSGLQQVTAINGKDPAENSITDYEYSHSPVGNIIEKSTEHGSYSYGYDSLYRLIDVKGPVEDESYEYDSLANRISSADFTDWNYNVNNQLTSYEPTTFKYDNHGNMVEKTTSKRVGG